MKNINGFSLIELMVVIIIIAILSITAVPKWFVSNSSLHLETDRLLDSIRFTKEASLSSGYPCSLTISGNTYQVNIEQSPAKIIKDAYIINDDISLVSSNNSIEFTNPNGLPISSYTITLTKNSNINTITIDSAGLITIMRN